MDEFDEKLKEYLVAKSAALLKCDRSEIQWEDDVDEYGYDSMELNQLCVDLGNDLSVEIQPAIFLEVTSLEALSRYLREHHFSAIEDRLL